MLLLQRIKEEEEVVVVEEKESNCRNTDDDKNTNGTRTHNRIVMTILLFLLPQKQLLWIRGWWRGAETQQIPQQLQQINTLKCRRSSVSSRRVYARSVRHNWFGRRPLASWRCLHTTHDGRTTMSVSHVRYILYCTVRDHILRSCTVSYPILIFKYLVLPPRRAIR